MTRIAATCIVLGVPLVEADAQPSPAPPSAARAVLDMQLHSDTTQPAPPPITGDEAARLYRAYLARVGTAPAASTPIANTPVRTGQ